MCRNCCGSKGAGKIQKGAWTGFEDKILRDYITTHGERKWGSISSKTGLKRCGKSWRLRWLNYLNPDIKRGNITPDEEDLIIRLHKLLGNRWALIAGRLPGRTDNEIKNYWNTNLSKKLQSVWAKPKTSRDEDFSSRKKPVLVSEIHGLTARATQPANTYEYHQDHSCFVEYIGSSETDLTSPEDAEKIMTPTADGLPWLMSNAYDDSSLNVMMNCSGEDGLIISTFLQTGFSELSDFDIYDQISHGNGDIGGGGYGDNGSKNIAQAIDQAKKAFWG